MQFISDYERQIRIGAIIWWSFVDTLSVYNSWTISVTCLDIFFWINRVTLSESVYVAQVKHILNFANDFRKLYLIDSR